MKERVAIIEERPYGMVIINMTLKVKQFIPLKKFQDRVKWGIYEIVNACLI